MKVVVAGSRNITDSGRVEAAIEGSKFQIDELVSGGARGVDRLGEQWAEKNAVKVTRFLADWRNEGKKAGLIRNQKMADYADALVAIWDGQSRGTKHMLSVMETAGKPVYLHVYLPNGRED